MPKKSLFSRKAFQYFEQAKENKNKKKWFLDHQAEYEEFAKEPFEVIVRELDQRIGHRVPQVAISKRKISRPLRGKKGAARQGLVRASINFYLAEKTTSRFEWNPGLFMQLGDEKEDNVIGIGLYGPSSRQIKRLRRALSEDYASVDRLLADRKLKKFWGTLTEEKYKRFPKDYSPESAAAKYLWYKQFHLSRHFTRKEVLSPDFPDTVLKAYEAAVPFLQWIRDSIGVYDRKEWEREKASEMARAGEIDFDEGQMISARDGALLDHPEL